MSVRLRSSSIVFGLSAALSLPLAASPRDVRLDPLAQHRNQSTVHGLYEIREAARAFLKTESAIKKKQLSPMDPDLRVIVPRCVVPLTARWAQKSVEHRQPGVDVICKKSVDKNYDYSWDVFVPLFEPEVAARWRELKRKNAVNPQRTK